MDLKDSNDHRCYMSSYGIPTIQLGCGGVIVGDLNFSGGDVSGIGFSLGAGEVGQHHKDLNGKQATDIGTFLQIIATKPESLQVVIDKLELAKQDLIEKLGA